MGAKHHAVTDFRVTVTDFVTGTAEGHAVQETDVVADDSGFTDDDVCGVVNQKPVTDFGGRMNVHAELAANDALEHLGGEGTTFLPKGVGGAISLQTLETLEEQKRFQETCTSRVAEDCSIQILACACDQFRILEVKNAENLFKFGAVNHLACKLT